MTTAVVRYAFATFSLNAKLHHLLSRLEERQRRLHHKDVLAFDAEIDNTLSKIETKTPTLRDEARSMELGRIRHDFNELERLFSSYRRSSALPESVAERFDRIFSELREKIREKEFF